MAVNLTEKLGPLPYWAWIGLGVGGVAVVTGMRRKKNAAVADSVAGGADSIDGLGSGTGGGSGSVTDAGPPKPSTNTAWSIHAADDLISRGYDPTLVESAIAKYLSGQQLTNAEQSVIGTALSLFGSPPEGVIPITAAPGSGSGSQGGPSTGNPGSTTPPPATTERDPIGRQEPPGQSYGTTPVEVEAAPGTTTGGQYATGNQDVRDFWRNRVLGG